MCPWVWAPMGYYYTSKAIKERTSNLWPSVEATSAICCDRFIMRQIESKCNHVMFSPVDDHANSMVDGPKIDL